MNQTPRLEIYTDRVAENARAVLSLCHSRRVNVACVTKGVAAHPVVAELFLAEGADMLGDSRIANIRALRGRGFSCPFMLLRLPAPSEAALVVETADYSLNSSLVTLKALSEASLARGVNHKVIIMVDVGDLREGLWPDRLVDLVKEAKSLRGIEMCGLGCNLACFGGVVPTVENMTKLISCREACQRETGLELPILSGGNSSGLPMLAAGEMPEAINHFRVGEAILLGRNVIDRSPLPGLRQDTIRVVGEIIELERKPSVPVGTIGQDAFGFKHHFPDRGIRRRAICNFGRQDMDLHSLFPVNSGVKVIGASSDHVILDVEEASPDLNVGDELTFYPAYGALLEMANSPYVYKCVVKGE